MTGQQWVEEHASTRNPDLPSVGWMGDLNRLMGELTDEQRHRLSDIVGEAQASEHRFATKTGATLLRSWKRKAVQRGEALQEIWQLCKVSLSTVWADNYGDDPQRVVKAVQRLLYLMGSYRDGSGCTCTELATPHDCPPEWENDPWCRTHPDMDYILGWATRLGLDIAPAGPKAEGHWPTDADKQDWLPRTYGVLLRVVGERMRQVDRYGHNEDLKDGTGPLVQWLRSTDVNLDLRTATEIEAAFRAEYERSERAIGAPTWMRLVREEVAEAFAEDNPKRLAEELVQVAALCVSWVEKLEARTV